MLSRNVLVADESDYLLGNRGDARASTKYKSHHQTAEDWLQVSGTYVMSVGEKKIIALRKISPKDHQFYQRSSCPKLSAKTGDVLGFKKLAFPLFRRLCRPVLCQLLLGDRFAASPFAARRVDAVSKLSLKVH